ncbi:MAG: type 3 domain protein [Chitinophagaceae bacterium]|jgi:hypothetical protein|nr:type 3 domain protein [Chitinophagaceae bacterium]
MKKAILLLILAVATSTSLFAQLAIVMDSDGFTNIRNGPSKDSAVIDTLSAGRLVYCFDEEEDAEGWYPVDYHRNGQMHSGYIHKTRVAYLERMEPFFLRSKGDTLYELRHDSIYITIKVGKANLKGRKLAYDESSGGKFLSTIDGREIFGTDGELPRREYKSIVIKNGTRILRLDKKKYHNFFEPSTEGAMAMTDPSTGIIYLVSYNSDGAGAYIVTWMIRDNKVINTETFLPF